MVDQCIVPSSVWRWPSLYKVPKKEQPMIAPNCVRTYRNSPLTVSVQLRLMDSFAVCHLTFAEAQQFANAILKNCVDGEGQLTPPDWVAVD
jgi:hypothetical protein